MMKALTPLVAEETDQCELAGSCVIFIVWLPVFLVLG